VVENNAGSLFDPFIDLIEPAIEDFGGAGEGEVGVDEVVVVGRGDLDVIDGKIGGKGRELAEFDDLLGVGAGSALGSPLVIGVFGGKGRKNDQDAVEGGAELTNRHGGNDLPEG